MVYATLNATLVVVSLMGVFFAFHLNRQTKRLNTLRANAFITNAKGHRVRYVNATPEEQARAESN